MQKRCKAFTLVELLVVIGIIALLISILLPALNRARESAKRIQCGSQIRQFALCTLMYARDNNEYLPWKTGGGVMSMQSGGAGAGEYGGIYNLYQAKYLRDLRLTRCPSLISPNTGWQNGDLLAWLGAGYLGYDMRGLSQRAVLAGTPYVPGTYLCYWIKTSKMTNDYILMHCNLVQDADLSRPFLEMNWTSHRRNSGLPAGSNFVKLDGSVEWREFGTFANPGKDWYLAWGAWHYLPTGTYFVADQHDHYCPPGGPENQAMANEYFWSGPRPNSGSPAQKAARRGICRMYP